MENKEKMKKEAIKRMKKLKIHPNAIKDFDEEDKVNVSRNGGILYWLNKEERKIVKKFEEEHDYIVYHVIENYLSSGDKLYSLMFVGEDEGEWKWEMEETEEDGFYSFVWVENVNTPMFSEFGTISIKPHVGGVQRLG